MDRPLFDPSLMAKARQAAARQGDAPASPAPIQTAPVVSAADRATPDQTPSQASKGLPTLSVSQLAERIDSALNAMTPARVAVVGEVSGFRDRTHWYFDLKDADAVVSCVAFASVARRCGLTLTDGMSVLVRGRVEFYKKAGKVSFIADAIEVRGEGALDLALRQLIEKLRARGWLDPERKRQLPRFPRRIAVITSRTGAALQDVLVTMKRRCPAISVLIADARVQGDGAAAELTQMVRTLGDAHERFGLDALLLTRGGGSKEDLWCFNDEQLAAAIVSCPIPVVAAIGHETDVSIAELVADERCATPTQAAVRLTPDTAALLRQLDSIQKRLAWQVQGVITQDQHQTAAAAQRLHAAVTRHVSQLGASLSRTQLRLERLRPEARQARLRARLETAHHALAGAMRARLAALDLHALETSLASSIARRISEAALTLDSRERELEAVSPVRVLGRGYSVTLTADGQVVRSPLDVGPGDPLTTRTAQGEIRSTVQGTAQDAALPTPAPLRPRKPRSSFNPRSSPKPETGGGLFDAR